MKKINKSYPMVGILLTWLALVASTALAQTGAQVYPQAVTSSGDTLTVDVMAENVTNLYGVEFRLKFDPAVVAVLDAKPERDGLQIEAGTLLPEGQGFVVANQVNETEGTVTFAMTLLNPAPPVSGNGPLARLRFNQLQNTPSTVEIEDIKLVTFDLQSLPAQTTPLIIDQQTTTAVYTGTFPWWIVAVVIMVLGIAGLGAFVAMGGFKDSQAKQQTAPSTTVKTRPSAFK